MVGLVRRVLPHDVGGKAGHVADKNSDQMVFMKFKIETVKFIVPKGADEKSLDKKIGRWANTKAYGVAWTVNKGLVSVDFWRHTGLLKEDPKEFGRACRVLNRIVANSAPKPEPTPPIPEPPRWTRRSRGCSIEDPEIFVLERRTLMAKDCVGSVKIEVCKNYNGSGGDAFGGASEWPVIDLHVPFQVGEEPKRLLFLGKLQKFIEENL